MRQLIVRGLTYYWRTHVAVVLGVATAVAVLAGALLVGDSVRGSLRDLVLARLGHTDHVLASANFFREALADDLRQEDGFGDTFADVAPLIIAQGFVTAQASGRTVAQVRVYGVDDRFWRFHHASGTTGPAARDAFISPALAAQLEASDGSALLVRVARPTDLPLESLFAQKDGLGRTLRLTVSRILSMDSLGEFALDAQQGEVRAVFVPLTRLQQEIEVPGRVNAVLVSAGANRPADATARLTRWARRRTTLEDVGLRVGVVPATGQVAVTSDAGVLDDAHVAVVTTSLGDGLRGHPLFTYLANTMRVGDHELPYALVSAIDLEAVAPASAIAPTASSDGDGIVLNEWAAEALAARVGDALTLEYYAWEEPGQLATRSHAFAVRAIVPIAAGDRDMAPRFPGISDSPTLDAWDPPFPVDLSRVRPRDEDYWSRHRTTPKAFIPIAVGQRLWGTRYGATTALRVDVPPGQSAEAVRDALAARLRDSFDPFALGLTVRDVRAEGTGASRGATDFGEYFLYFSFFLVVSALLLASLFFKLGVEQRVREVGLLRAVGFEARDVRRVFITEGLVLAVAGSLLGVVGAVGYAAAIMAALRTWWVDAVGTTALTLHVSPVSLVSGAVGGVVAAVACIAWTLRSLGHLSERSLLAGEVSMQPTATTGRRLPLAAGALALVGAVLLGAGAAGAFAAEGAFFGAGFALLGAALCAAGVLLRRRTSRVLGGAGWRALARLGWRNATYRPGRSVLSMAVIASATFILVSVDAFRRGDLLTDGGRATGTGGYAVLVETLLPVVRDPNSRQGRDALNLFALDASTRIEPFRLLPGDDASCLNLYAPVNPRIVAPRDAFLDEGRFAFQDSLASTDAERANPWLLLRRTEPDGAIPVVADANSMAYVLHRRLGDEIVLARGGAPIRLRLVASLRDSIFQGELVMSEPNFARAFPNQEGYRVLLVESASDVRTLSTTLEDAMVDLGADAIGTSERLARYHRVENTYLSTFQTLGGLGLLLGTVGLATVLLRNVLERRRELALLGAVGFERRQILGLVLAENVLLLCGGLLIGAVCAGLAIAPAVAERGGRVPMTSGGALLLGGVLLVGVLSSVAAMGAATRAPLLASLRSE